MTETTETPTVPSASAMLGTLQETPAPPPSSEAQFKQQLAAEKQSKLDSMEEPVAAELHEYSFGYAPDDGKPVTQSDLENELTIRSWMVEAGLSKGDGSFIGQEARKLIPQLAAMTDGERGLFQAGERQRLQKLWGDDFSKNLAAARKHVQRIEALRPGIVDFLERSGLGDSATLIHTLANMAKRRMR